MMTALPPSTTATAPTVPPTEPVETEPVEEPSETEEDLSGVELVEWVGFNPDCFTGTLKEFTGEIGGKEIEEKYTKGE